MRKSLKLALSGALCSATLAAAIPTEAFAGPMSAPDRSVVAPASPVENVWYRRGWRGGGWGWRRAAWGPGWRYRRWGVNPGAVVATGVGLGLLGAGLAATSYYDYPYGYGYGWGYPYGAWGGWGWGGGWGGWGGWGW